MPEKILVIEDDHMISRALHTRLTALGFAVVAAADGPSGINTAEALKPDVILLDFRMPGMDGVEVCKRLKLQPSTCGIPVVFLSANLTDDVLDAGLEAGVVDFMSKPYDSGRLLSVIQRSIVNSSVLSSSAQE